MKRGTIRILTASAIGAVGLAGLAAVGLADDDHGGRFWGKHGGGYHMGMGGGHGFGRRGGMHEMMLRFDANSDGKLTQEEIDQGRANQLAEFDKDGDGTLNLAEYEALWLDVMRERMVDRFQAHDDDGDGKVTPEEFGSRFADMVQYMDMNDDGALSEEDMRRRHRGERGGRGDDD